MNCSAPGPLVHEILQARTLERGAISFPGGSTPCLLLPLQCHAGPLPLLPLLSHFSRVRLCDTTDGSPPGSPIPGILQARTLERGAISFPGGSTPCLLLPLQCHAGPLPLVPH